MRKVNKDNFNSYMIKSKWASNRINLCQKYLDMIAAYSMKTGISCSTNEFIKRSWIFRRHFINLIIFIILLREMISLSLNNKYWSLMLGDLSFNWKYKVIWNSFVIIVSITGLLTRYLHYHFFEQGVFPMDIKNFYGNYPGIDWKSIFLIQSLALLKKFYPFLGATAYLITMYINCSLVEFLTVAMIWCFICTPYCVYMQQTLLINMVYFCLNSYKFKLKLQLENIRLEYISFRSIPRALFEKEFLRIISRILRNYELIRIENRFWSKWLFIQIVFMSTSSATFVNHMMFGETNLYISILVIAVLVMMCIYILLVNICCIRLNNEANRTSQMVYSLIFRQTRSFSTVQLKLKVFSFVSC